MRTFSAAITGRLLPLVPSVLLALAFAAIGQAEEDGRADETAKVEFEPPREITVNDDDPAHGNFLLDLDKGKVFSPPKDFRPRSAREMLDFLRKQGVDALGESYGILGIDFIAIPVRQADWDPQLAGMRQVDEIGEPGTPIPITGHGKLPATYLFKTRDGAKGVLQILSFNPRTQDKPPSTTIRYKLLKEKHQPKQ